MRKTYQMLFAFVLMAFYAMDASAGLKRVPLTTDMFFTWNGYGADAQKTSETPAACSWEVGKPSQMIYGGGNVDNNYADLSAYKTLEIYYTSGTPRPMLNRAHANGQWSADEAASELIEYPKGGGDTWSGKYFKDADGVLTVDLAQLVADKGFAHLHAIKGANWTDCVVTKLALISDDGRVELEAEMFKAWTTAGADAVEITEEEGRDWESGEKFGCEVGYFKNVDGGAVIYGNGNVIWQWYADLTGTKKMYFTGEKGISFRVLYNRMPPEEGDSDPHGHAVPEKVVTIGDDGTAVLDVEALMQENNLEFFHVNCIKIGWGASSLRFGNVELEGTIKGSGKIYDPLDDITAGFEADVVSINLGNNTNLKKLLGDNERLILPIECGKVTVNDRDIKLMSVEAYMYKESAHIFLFMDDMNDAAEETDVVKASFFNPTDEAQQLMITGGRFAGMAVPDVKDLKAEYEAELGNEYSNQAKLPVIVSAVPELGSINLPLDKTEFKVVFSGNVNAAEMKATFDGKAMTFAPAEGFASEFTLTRAAGNLEAGIHQIKLSNIKAEQDFLEEVGEETIKYSFGVIESDETVETLMTDGFKESGNGTVPAAWIVNSDSEERTNVSNLWGGCRVVETSGSFATHVLYLCSRGNEGNVGHAYYGMNDQKLTLETKTYHLTADFGGWDGVNRALKVQVVSEETEEIIAETLEPVTVTYTSGDKNHMDLEFTVTTPGNYILKFFPCNLEGNPAGWGDALAVGNIMVQYIPNVMGIEMTQALKQALADASTARDNNASERYAGDAFTTLNNLVTKYTTETLCQPSEFAAATKALNEAAATMTAHHTLCDNFDALPAQLYAKLPKADSKFAATAAYAEVKAIFDKYATVKDEIQIVDEVETVVTVVTPKFITNDDELNAGITEMNKAITMAGMFTEGASQNNTTGYAALHERLRVGVETAIALGVAEDDPAVVAANAELGDNDAVANNLKATITKQLYTNLKANATVEEPVDMTVFIKNPNIYVTKASKQDVTAAPGWTLTNIGGGNLGDLWYTAGGGTHFATDEVPADEAISCQGNVTFTQDIADLPAGVYSVTAYMGERRSDNDFRGFGEGETDDEKLENARATIFPQEFVFVNTTATAEGEYDNQTPVVSNGTSWGATDNNRIISQEFTITDGKATIGVKSSGQNTWFAFNEIHLSLVSAAAGIDYAKALEDFVAGIETLEGTPAKVRAIQLFDMNGRRVAKAQKGITIMKKVMSDGSIKTEKVIVK